MQKTLVDLSEKNAQTWGCHKKLLDGSPIPDSRDNRLDYENTDNPLQDTDFEGIWIIKPFHTMEQTIKKAPLVH